MRKIVYFLFMLFSSLEMVFSQNYNLSSVEIDKAITPTSSVASLGSYGNNAVVDNYGKYNTSINLLNLKNGDLDYNLGISYSSNGLKLNEWGGRIGLSWNDNFTSAIYRTIRGLPDDYSQKVNYIGDFSQSEYVTIRDMYESLIANSSNGKDGESDIFYYNIAGQSGSFVIVNGLALQLNYKEKVKIEIGSDLSQFVITLKDGTQYFYGTGNNIEYTTYDTQCNEENAPPLKQKTAWFLTKIKNITNEINFSYDSISTHYVEDYNESFVIKNKVYSGDFYFSGCTAVPTFFSDKYCKRFKTYDTKYLTKVESTSFLVNFIYNPREDIGNEKILDRIDIKNNQNMLVNNIKFDYVKYGTNQGSNNDNWGTSVRYFLDKVKVGKLYDNVYSFVYNNPSQLPARFTKGIDLAGIYNGKSNSSLLPNKYVQKVMPLLAGGINYPVPSGDRDPYFPYSTYGSLKSILYPTKGSEEIEYESNTIIKDSTVGIEPYYGIRVKSIKLYSDNNIVTEKKYLYNLFTYNNGNQIIYENKPSSLFQNMDEYGGHFSTITDGNQVEDCGGGSSYPFDPTNPQTWSLFYYYKLNSFSKYDLNSFQGNFITYGNVTEIIGGESFIAKQYSVAEDASSVPLLGQNCTYYPFSNHAWLSGTLTGTYEGNFKNNIYNLKRIRKFGFEYKDYQFINNYTINRDYFPNTYFNNNFYSFNLEAFSITKYTLTNRWLNNILVTETEFGDNGQKIEKSSSTSYFDTTNYNNIKNITDTNPDGQVVRTEFQYAKDLYTSGDFFDNYMVGIPLITTNFKNNIPILKTKLSFSKNWLGHDKFLPLKKETGVINTINTNNEVFETDITCNQYDNNGNLLQYTSKDGIPTAIIWGYKNSLPIAKIKGATYPQIQNLAGALITSSNADIDSSTETTFITALDNFRKNSNLSSYQITTYTYDPLIGVTSITPPSGIREVYLYDTANRLKEIRQQEKDSLGNMIYKIVKEFKYNYKN